MRYFKLIFICLFLTNSVSVFGQDNNSDEEVVSNTKSFINKDDLVRYLGAAVGNDFFTEDDGTFSFNGSIYGFRSVLNPGLKIDTIMRRYKWQRDLNIGFDISIDDDNKISSFSPSLKFAVINKRDFAKASQSDFQRSNAARDYLVKVHELAGSKFIGGLNADQMKKYQEQTKKYNESGKLSDLDPKYVELFYNELKQSGQNIDSDLGFTKNAFEFLNIDSTELVKTDLNGLLKKIWEKEKELIERRALLTFNIKPSFGDGITQSLNGELKYLKGLSQKPSKKPWDIEAVLSLQNLNDTINTENSVWERQIVKGQIGVNKVLKERKDNSLLELKSGLEYSKILEGVHQGEDETTFNFFATLTVRLSEKVYFPFSLKYDPENNDLFGLFRVQWNFEKSKK